MEEPRRDRDDVTDYYYKFLNLVELLLDNRWLDEDECNILFWYGFHPENCMIFLCCLSSSHYQPSGMYFSLKQVFHIASEIFLQRPRDLLEKCQDTLEQGLQHRRTCTCRCDIKHKPLLSKYRAQDIIQDLKDKVWHRKKLA